jgi:hypothetical protein
VTPGETFYLTNVSGTRHVVVVLADIPERNEVLLVSITTYKAYKDNTCIIEQRDYAWLQHTSCIDYGRAFLAVRSCLQREIDEGRVSLGPPPVSL